MRRPVYTESQLREAIAASHCWSDVLRRLGRRPAGGNHRVVRKYAEAWGISTEHFDPEIGRKRGRASRTAPLSEVLVTNSTYPRTSLKRRLFNEGVKERRCELCGQGEEWRGRKMSLILDHINGVADDNRLENLQIVCPNCAATLDTHCGRNPVLQIPRQCLVCESEFLPRYAQQRHCSKACGLQHENRPQRGVAQPGIRKVERPPYDQLMRELAETNYSAVGRKYGVSDNAVRKWVRFYERSMDEAA